MFGTGDFFWYDPGRSVVKSRDDLIRDLNFGGAGGRGVADDAYDVILRLMYAFVSGTPIDLLEGDTDPHEGGRGVTDVPGSDECPTSVEVRDWDDLIRLIELHADEPTVGMYTSGTTGKPRRVIHSFSTLTRGIRTGERHASAVWALAYDPSHLAGIQVMLQAILTGCPLVYVFPMPGADLLDCFERCDVTHISATPTFYRRLLFSTTRPLPGVHVVACGGEPLDSMLVDELRRLFPSAGIKNIYALSEAGSLFASDGDAFAIPESRSEKIDVAPDGELLIHRSLLAAFDEDFEGDWYHTGDVVDCIENGRFRITHRKTEVINVGGTNVDPHEVEHAILEVKGVGDTVVAGRPNRITGNILEAQIVRLPIAPDEDALEDRIVRHLSSRLQPFKIPRIFRFVEELELTRTGKKERS